MRANQVDPQPSQPKLGQHQRNEQSLLSENMDASQAVTPGQTEESA